MFYRAIEKILGEREGVTGEEVAKMLDEEKQRLGMTWVKFEKHVRDTLLQ